MSTYIRAEALLDLADTLDAEAREYAVEADPLPLGDPRRHALLGRILGKKASAQRIRDIAIHGHVTMTAETFIHLLGEEDK